MMKLFLLKKMGISGQKSICFSCLEVFFFDVTQSNNRIKLRHPYVGMISLILDSYQYFTGTLSSQ